MSQPSLASQIQSTAGAVAVLNEKGAVSMQKVKVFRYISGRRPKYAPEETSDEESDEEFPFTQKSQVPEEENIPEDVYKKSDPRLRRLEKREIRESESDDDNENRLERHRQIHEPEVIGLGGASDAESEGGAKREDDESSEDEDLDEDEIERRRLMIRMKAMEKVEEEEELLALEQDERNSEPDLEESETEEETESEDEMEQRLKPVFVRKRDRVTVEDKEEAVRKEKELEQQAKRQAEERRRQTLKMIEEDAKKELMTEKESGMNNPADLINTDDENDESAYESWKLRELKRIKRDKDLRENYDKERQEIDRIHNMTEEERRVEERVNPRTVTNKPAKGKYKFLQKYYHRGAFFLSEEDTVYKRDFSAPTLEDHFDKTVLPKVMQVKNFGRSGRTKYTHLVDQDTTLFDSPWMAETAQNIKFHHNQAGGMKQSFDRPSVKKQRKK